MANKNKKYKRSIEDINKIDTSFNYRHSNVDTRSDTTRKGYHEGNTYSYQSRSYHPFIDLYNFIDYHTNATNPNSPRYNPGLITGIAPNINIKDYTKIIKALSNIDNLQKSTNIDKFVKFLSDKTGKSIKRVKIKDTKIGDVYSDGYSYIDDTGREIAHIAGNRKNNNVFVESSYVDPEFRSKGLGKQMYFDFNKQVFDKYGTTLHSSPYQHQTTLETSPGSGVFISPSSKLWKGLKQNNMATIQGKGLDKYYVMDIPSNIIPKFKNGGIYKRSIEDAGMKIGAPYYDTDGT